MKRLLIAFVFLTLSSITSAQQATIISPVADSAYKVLEYTIARQQVIVRLRITDASDNSKQFVTIVDNDTAAFLQALDTAIANEAGGVIRKREARVLKRLQNAGLLPGVNVEP